MRSARILVEDALDWERQNRLHEEDREYEVTLTEMAKMTWKEYIPPAISGALTISAIIMANRIGTRRTAAMAAAYSLSDKAFSEYKEKVVEHIGKNKELKVRDEIAQDRVNDAPVGTREVIITGGGEVLFFDMYTSRYFKSDMETVKKAMNDVNYMILNHDSASLTDFYDKIGLSRTKHSDDVGWNHDKLLDIQFSTTMSEDDRPCIAIDFKAAPIRNYFRMH